MLAGPGQLLLLTGGDDQALRLCLLQLGCCADSGAGPATCGEMLQLCIPNAHSSALRSAWLSPLSRAAVAPPALEAVAFTLGLDQQVRCWRVRLRHQEQEQQAPVRPHNAGGSEAEQPQLGAACYRATSGGGSTAWQLDVAEVGCRYTQVVEPAALDVLEQGATPVPASLQSLPEARRFLLGVTGRGTEVLTWSAPHAATPWC